MLYHCCVIPRVILVIHPSIVLSFQIAIFYITSSCYCSITWFISSHHKDYCFSHIWNHHHTSFILHVTNKERKDIWECLLMLYFYAILVGQDSGNRRTELDFPHQGVETDTTHRIPVVPDTNYGPGGNEVLIMNTKNEDRPTSFFAQPGILAGKYCVM